MATATIPTPTLPSYQTIPLEEYSQEFQGLAHRLFQRVSDIVRSRQPKSYPGSYSIFAATSYATVAKVIIYEDGKGKTNGDWPDLRDGAYALIRANDEIGDRIWNELLPPQLPAQLDRANRHTTIGVAPRHSEQFAYIRVTEENLEVIASLPSRLRPRIAAYPNHRDNEKAAPRAAFPLMHNAKSVTRPS